MRRTILACVALALALATAGCTNGNPPQPTPVRSATNSLAYVSTTFENLGKINPYTPAWDQSTLRFVEPGDTSAVPCDGKKLSVASPEIRLRAIVWCHAERTMVVFTQPLELGLADYQDPQALAERQATRAILGGLVAYTIAHADAAHKPNGDCLQGGLIKTMLSAPQGSEGMLPIPEFEAVHLMRFEYDPDIALEPAVQAESELNRWIGFADPSACVQ